jgi:hypothetical protein
VRNLIGQQRDQYNWAFQFLGAAETAWQGRDMGMSSSSFTGTGRGQGTAYNRLNNEMKEVRRLKKQMFEMEEVIPEVDDESGKSA